MSGRNCKQCGAALSDAPDVHFCPKCGHPAGDIGWIRGGRDLRRVAQIQRQLLWFVLAQLGCYFLLLSGQHALPPALSVAPAVAYFTLFVITIIQVVRLSTALGDGLALRIVGGVLMLIPCISLVFLLSVNGRATRALRKGGLTVGFMGVSDEQVVTHLGPNRCRGCGYDLTGNVSGRCSECGTPVPPGFVGMPPPPA